MQSAFASIAIPPCTFYKSGDVLRSKRSRGQRSHRHTAVSPTIPHSEYLCYPLVEDFLEEREPPVDRLCRRASLISTVCHELTDERSHSNKDPKYDFPSSDELTEAGSVSTDPLLDKAYESGRSIQRQIENKKKESAPVNAVAHPRITTASPRPMWTKWKNPLPDAGAVVLDLGLYQCANDPNRTCAPTPVMRAIANPYVGSARNESHVRALGHTGCAVPGAAPILKPVAKATIAKMTPRS